MKTYKIKSSAVRAAKKEMGENWAEFASIEAQGEEFVIALKNPEPIAPQLPSDISSAIASVALLAENQLEIEKKAEKKAEIESRKPIHIPSTPLTSIVKEKSAPTPDPIPSPSEKIAPPADSGVPDEASIAPDEMSIALAAADKAANAAIVNVNPAKPRLSTTDKPTKKVWHVADAMLIAAQKAGLPQPSRKEVIEECVRQGIAYGTSRTQYQHWFKCYNDSIAAPIATIGKDGKIVPPTAK